MSTKGKKVQSTCAHCGVDFLAPVAEVKRGNGKYCSRKCFADASRTSVTRVCLQCGKNFLAKVSTANKGLKVYCSIDCYKASRPSPISRNCIYCGTAFFIAPSKVKLGAGKYCSRKCKDLAGITLVSLRCLRCDAVFSATPSQISSGRKYCSHQCAVDASWSQIPCSCKVCAKEFTASPAQIKRGEGQYCSYECAGVANRGHKSRHWRGGTSEYRGPNWQSQRKLAYMRDGGVCQRCGKKPRKGQRKFAVHHIAAYRTFNGDYERANDLSNLITLCHQCHHKADWSSAPVPKRLL